MAISERKPRVPARQTRLDRALESGEVRQRYTVLDAFNAAKRRFSTGVRVDMQDLAEELAISRVTLYRWVGSREQLMTEVLWACTDHHFTMERRTRRKGPLAARALSAFVRVVNEHPGMRQLLDDEPEFALNLLTNSASVYQKRYLALVRELIAQDRTAGLVSKEIPLEDLAYCAARITQSYIHTRAITGDAPDAARASTVLGVLLR